MTVAVAGAKHVADFAGRKLLLLLRWLPHEVPRRSGPLRRRRGRALVNDEIRALQAAMERDGYVADPAIATAAYLAREMRKPLLVEGEAGVGKTELAKVLARVLGTELIRLQCYEGLDTNTALYEWNYQRQLLRLRIAEREAHDPAALEELIFSRDVPARAPAAARDHAARRARRCC